MKKRLLYTTLLLSVCFSSAFAQMWNGKDTIYGNEWINFQQQYYKIQVAEDGIYRIPYATLNKINGFSAVEAKNVQLYYMGQEIPLYSTATTSFSNSDYIEFYGQKNRGKLDEHLFMDANAQQINREHSLFNDTSAYFLTWSQDLGKRYKTSATDLNNLPPREISYTHEQKIVYNGKSLYIEWDKYNTPIDGDKIARSQFDTGEGFADAYAKTKTVTITADNVASNAGDATCVVRYGLNGYKNGQIMQHKTTIMLEGVVANDLPTSDLQVKELALILPNNKITNNNKLLIEDKGSAESMFRVANISFTYPRLFKFNNKSVFDFSLAQNDAKYLKISAFKSTKTPILYDFVNEQRIASSLDSGFVKITLPTATLTRKCVLINPDSVRVVGDISKVDFIDYSKSKADYLILSNKRLFSDPLNGGQNWVQAFADYRASAVGGAYTTSVIEIQQLYDQFAYGINRHNICTRNFSNFLIKKAPTKPEYLFILGKGIEYREARTTDDFQFRNSRFFVPTYGYPPSDNLLSATNTRQVGFATGRIPAIYPHEIKDYLDKIKQYDANINLPLTYQDRAWMKKIVHVAGTDGNLIGKIIIRLNQMENIISNSAFGGVVSSFYKTGNDAIQTSTSQELKNIFDNGCSIVTFFGHSAVTTLDYSFDEASTWKKSGRYPLMIGLGCNSGNMHTYNKSVGERYTLEKDRGMIAFAGESSFGIDDNLAVYNNNVYNRIGNTSYGATMGKVFLETNRSYGNLPYSIQSAALVNQFTFQGDPALRFYQNNTPDYTIDATSVRTVPSILNAQLDSFKIKCLIANIGKITSDTTHFTIIQELPNGKKIKHIAQNIAVGSNPKELTFSIINKSGAASAGLNRFYIKIDANNTIKELPNPLAELNNDYNNGKGFETFILTNDAQPVSPPPYSIVNKTPFVLRASTSDVFALSQKYILQMDTSRLFNSPWLTQKTIVQKGGLMDWNPDINTKDSTVYYWRVTPDSTKTQKYNWNNSSFVYIKSNPEGWNQSHFFQLNDNNLLNLDWKNRTLKYQNAITNVRITNGVHIENVFRPEIGINNYPMPCQPSYDAINNEGVVVCVIDSISGYTWENKPKGIYGNYTTQDWKWNFSYKTNSKAERAKLFNLLENVVPNKNYVLIMTLQDAINHYHPEQWASDSVAVGDKNLFNFLEKQGAQQIRRTAKTGAKPYYFLYRKNDPSFAVQENLADSISQIINNDHNIVGRKEYGEVNSALVGPVKSWEKLFWKYSNKEKNDLVALDVIGVKADKKTETIIYKNVTTKDTTLNGIDAKIYPYLKLRYRTSDSTRRTAAQLDYWRVHYQPLPEAALDPTVFFDFYRDTLQQGDNMRIGMGIKNISTQKMDSVLVRFNIKDENNNEITRFKRYKALAVNDTIQTSLLLNTRYLSGKQQITIEANPKEDQPEQYHFNNVGIKNFYVNKDVRNPLLDVTFDGQHILNGDIVSAKPNILIAVRDENKFLLLNDTSKFTVLLRGPKDSVATPIPLSSAFVKFYAASSTKDNVAKIELSPTLSKDGNYTLLVRARDASDNHTSDLLVSDIQQDPIFKDKYNYKIDFQVINKTSISNVLNYPNPFSTHTQFVYTLTGSTTPDFFKIQIMTISGKVVREITQDELGSLKIGTHRTDYTWNGTDEYGDKLGNGVYLYRIVTQKADGSAYEKYDNNTDAFFKNGFGKMVILR